MATQWLNGEPSFSVSITPAEALEELRDAAQCAREYYNSRDKRIQLSLAMAWLEWKLEQGSKDMTANTFETEEGRLAAAERAGRNVALFELRNGHTVPRSWEKDGDVYAGAYSHLAAVGFTRLGCRSYALPFINAYRAEFRPIQDKEL